MSIKPDIANGAIEFKELLEIGESMFAARWTKLDGQGRPADTVLQALRGASKQAVSR